MADAAPAPVKKTPKKKASKPKKPSAHPKYSEMIKAAISALKVSYFSSALQETLKSETVYTICINFKENPICLKVFKSLLSC